ncbi:MAG: U32 family peptidase [Bacteroidaceae bacterium]|nr:U32 family peptidase [Bacteroidaceae bacterium]
MKSDSNPIELLSPARDLVCGLEAIDHGADAVYIGASHFGARSVACNSTKDIGILCDYAHRYGAKVYAAVNTILYDTELEDCRRLAWELYDVGVDALIVQDMSFCTFIPGVREAGMPPIPLHASTQMDNRTPEKVALLAELGFEQVVLARELSLKQISRIHKTVPDVRLEAFVHGALCVSYSGQCYASQFCFDRSANRGRCAQFCRLPFTLLDAGGKTLIGDKYLLSLRDTNRLENLEEMLDAGVSSFKIEGRLKDVAYVKNVTAAYRQALDAIMKRRPEFVRSSFGTSDYTFQPDLSRSFSRGSTDYFLHGRTDDLASPDTPKSRGREVGHVKEVRGGCIIVSSSEVFTNGDGLCYFDTEGRLQGFRVNRAEGNHLYPAVMPDIRKGDRLWRSLDQQWERLMSGRTAERRIATRFTLQETEQGFRLLFEADDGIICSKDFPAEHQPARTDQTNSISDVLGKLGDTPYVCTDVMTAFSQPWFIPRSTLADWRREVMAEVEKMVKSRKREPSFTAGNTSAFRSQACSALPDAIPFKDFRLNVSNLMAEQFYNSVKCKVTEPALEVATPSAGKAGLPLMTCRFCIRHAWGQCKKEKPATGSKATDGRQTGDTWQDPLFLVMGDGRRFRLHFDCKKCEMTVLSV